MSPIAYRARALGPLRAIDWAIPSGVSVVVGPNRVGKSTLLRLPELVRRMLADGIHEAFKAIFEGVPHLRNLGMPASTPISLGVAVGSVAWEVDLAVSGGQIAELPPERLLVDGAVMLQRRLGSTNIEDHKGGTIPHGGLLPSLLLQQILPRLLGVYPDEDLDDNELTPSSFVSPELEERSEFVLATMREIFPHLGRIGFEQAGQTVTMTISDRRWPGSASIPIARESTGFITALLQLCAVASCGRGDLVTLDEIETSLHRVRSVCS